MSQHVHIEPSPAAVLPVTGEHREQAVSIIPTAWLRDTSLSYKARGILAVICAFEDGKDLTVDRLVNHSPEGRTAIQSGLQELERAGYLLRVLVRHPDGRLGGTVYSLRGTR